jgi:hypothetical protein
LTWRYNPFDFFAAPPCDTPGGGHCPQAPAHVADNNEEHDNEERTRKRAQASSELAQEGTNIVAVGVV